MKDQSLVSFARTAQEITVLRAENVSLKKRIQTLESYINEEGERNGVCTFGILQRECDGCGCEKGKK